MHHRPCARSLRLGVRLKAKQFTQILLIEVACKWGKCCVSVKSGTRLALISADIGCKGSLVTCFCTFLPIAKLWRRLDMPCCSRLRKRDNAMICFWVKKGPCCVLESTTWNVLFPWSTHLQFTTSERDSQKSFPIRHPRSHGVFRARLDSHEICNVPCNSPLFSSFSSVLSTSDLALRLH